MLLGACIEIYLTGYTCKTPEVLIFQVTAVTPTHDLHGNQVLAFLQIFGNIKLSSNLRILRIAHKFTIHPYLQIAGCRTYMEIHLLTFPIVWQHECPAIRARIVVSLANKGRITIEGRSPGITDVLIYLVAIAIDFKESWHRKIYPFRVVVLQSEKVLRSQVVVLYEVKSPHTLHRQVS